MRTSFFGYLLALILLNIPLIGYTTEPVTQLAQNDNWENLTPAQRQALAPLANDWNNFVPDRRQKWIVIADKYQKMNPEEQRRIHDKMQAWAGLTPAQRAVARENYLRSIKVQPEQRNQHWQDYQQLTEEQKAQLATHHEKKKLITNLPTPAESTIAPMQPLKKPHVKVAPTVPNNVVPNHP